MSIARGVTQLGSRVNQLKEQIFSPKNLFYTNIAISVSLSGVGDILEQHYEILQGTWEKWSPVRTRHMAISGMSVGIVCHHWYRFLDRKMPGRTIGIVLKKVLVDQMVCSPLCIGMFFVTLGILERNTWTEFKQEIRDKAHQLYLAEWIVWPPAQIINFYFLPTRFRVLYDNTISLGYDVYTSQVKHDKPVAEDKSE
ncbi:mpv17-like protein 2 [Neodiprion pinetum]|uniref:Mpv17-like protein 2 n=1 Tax=Neodiprion lecontei TaxID=441921 RepID=A0A6J0CED7_NEOLC|nr:mpv17-like protein 2 [Neodiprion lecontei]XP_015524449.1 mpv17-like protein 2 [Neodiprion lecontei]XP_046419098.1 mpv17-like protein 2 [Neodiprion fabricii]XP_046419099.1 mpv17-like protein 2 [Neodiprion fabricii]XP_046475174.1 mpv17-like protein 2 [Neodiprion pinetum]XP_046475175.1 mpv17-like protein 2 [Neodiprion pinetum]